jgi:hypothetical protein
MAIDIFKSLLYADDYEVFFGINPCHSVVLIGMVSVGNVSEVIEGAY